MGKKYHCVAKIEPTTKFKRSLHWTVIGGFRSAFLKSFTLRYKFAYAVSFPSLHLHTVDNEQNSDQQLRYERVSCI